MCSHISVLFFLCQQRLCNGPIVREKSPKMSQGIHFPEVNLEFESDSWSDQCRWKNKKKKKKRRRYGIIDGRTDW